MGERIRAGYVENSHMRFLSIRVWYSSSPRSWLIEIRGEPARKALHRGIHNDAREPAAEHSREKRLTLSYLR